MSDDVVDLARDLGRRIAEDPRTTTLKAASDAMSADPVAKKLEEEYSRTLNELRALEEGGRPIEPDLKRRVLALQEQVRRSQPLQRLLKAHHEFGEMMEEVQRAIGEPVDAALAVPGSSEEKDDGPRLIVPS